MTASRKRQKEGWCWLRAPLRVVLAFLRGEPPPQGSTTAFPHRNAALLAAAKQTQEVVL